MMKSQFMGALFTAENNRERLKKTKKCTCGMGFK